MARGPRKHLKRLRAPKHWMLNKLGGQFAPRPTPGPHKLRECIPLVILLRNRLHYALTRNEAQTIAMQRFIKVDGKIRTDINFPAGFMDVVSIDRTNEIFRLLFDTKGRFLLRPITPKEASYKLCQVRKVEYGAKGIPYLVTHDGRTIRYPDPDIKVSDTIKLDLAQGSILDHVPFDVGALAMITGGRNIGRIGTIIHREKHLGSHEIIHVRDMAGHEFATRLVNVFVIGPHEKKALVSIPKNLGIKKSIVEMMK